jgi:hypothetical protein
MLCACFSGKMQRSCLADIGKHGYDVAAWAEDQFGSYRLGDRRHTRRAVVLGGVL